jgi:hypothetical protein
VADTSPHVKHGPLSASSARIAAVGGGRALGDETSFDDEPAWAAPVILKVERVQNPGLWARYSQQKRLIASRVSAAGLLPEDQGVDARANEVWMKHGTGRGGASALEICAAPRGINPLFSADGYYGRAVYTAAAGVYSHSYASQVTHTDGQPASQMCLVRVAVGVPAVIKDRSGKETAFREPPDLPAGPAPPGAGQDAAPPQRADSVLANVRSDASRRDGGRFWAVMAYETAQVYPECAYRIPRATPCARARARLASHPAIPLITPPLTTRTRRHHHVPRVTRERERGGGGGFCGCFFHFIFCFYPFHIGGVRVIHAPQGT